MKTSSHKTWLVSWLLLLAFCCGNLTGQHNRDLLTGGCTPENLAEKLVPAGKWDPFGSLHAPHLWENVPEKLRSWFLEQAVELAGEDYDLLPASLFMEYVRNGNRTNYQASLFARRNRLAVFVVAEMLEGKGKYLDQITDGIWAICEETYWGVPAHVGAQKAGSGLPDVEEPTVDLFAAETGATLAWTYHLLGDKLDSISPLIKRRIEVEIDRRILSPCLERDDFWWMGAGPGSRVNNWNPWICSNWLTCILFIEKDNERRVRSVYKTMEVLDRFINSYPSDGGCDEGPGYWWRAAASMFECLELLNMATRGAIDISSHELVREMGRYICYAYISYPYFINFADASAIAGVNPVLLFRFGEMLDDRDMMGMASYFMEKENYGDGRIPTGYGSLGRIIPDLFFSERVRNVSHARPLFGSVWLPETEVMTAREEEGSDRGFFVAAKGGHNNESHNHNDVGNFIVYYNGKPFLVDAGVENYTAKTFSSRRYEIWTMQSAWHNLPTINGQMQRDGRAYRARNCRFSDDGSTVSFSLDIAGAYPDEAKVRNWNREIRLIRGKQLEIREVYSLTEEKEDTEIHLLSAVPPETLKKGEMAFAVGAENQQGNGARLVLVYPPDQCRQIKNEVIPIEDSRLRSVWGETLYRTSFVLKKGKKNNRFEMIIRPGQ